jgi:hypothetical protein
MPVTEDAGGGERDQSSERPGIDLDGVGVPAPPRAGGLDVQRVVPRPDPPAVLVGANGVRGLVDRQHLDGVPVGG